LFCWIQLSIITFPFSFDDIMTSNSWSLKSTNYSLVQLPWDLNFGLNIVHSWVTCFTCSMKQNLGQISQQAADVIISGWGGLFGLTSQFFMVKKPSIFIWWSSHFCWNPSLSCGFFPRWKVSFLSSHLSLVKSWEIHQKSSQFLGTPRCVPKSTSVSRHLSASVTVNARPSQLEIPGDLLLRTGQPLRNAGGAEIPGGHSAWRPDINGGMVWTPLKDIEPCTWKYIFCL